MGGGERGEGRKKREGGKKEGERKGERRGGRDKGRRKKKTGRRERRGKEEDASARFSSAVTFCNRLFTWPTDQPRHATKIFNLSGRFQIAPRLVLRQP